MKRLVRFFANALLLTLTSLIMRTVGVAYNVWISGKIGAAGMGLFTLVMSVYTLAVTLATSGINLAATRMTAEALGKNSGKEIRLVMRRCLLYSGIMGTASCLLLLFSADLIGNILLADARTVPSIRFLGVSMPFIAMSSAMNGYFTAMRRVVKNAGAQFFEQLVKIGVTSWALLYFTPGDIGAACLCVVAGGAIAELASFLLSFFLYLLDLRKHNDGAGAVMPKLTGKLLGITVPVAVSSYLRSGLVTVEHILIPYGLRKFGNLHDTALASYGILCGMALPLIFYPASLLYAFTGLIIPELSEERERGGTRIPRIVCQMFRWTMVYGIGAASVLLCFSHELGQTVYNNAEAGEYLRLIAPLIPIMYLDSSVDAMLKGLGEQVYCMKVNIADAALSVLLVWRLVPVFGVKGYIFVMFASEIFNMALSVCRLLRVTSLRVALVRWLIVPLLASVGATSSARLVFGLLPLPFPAGISLAVMIFAASAGYLLFLVMLGGVSLPEKVRKAFRRGNTAHKRHSEPHKERKYAASGMNP